MRKQELLIVMLWVLMLSYAWSIRGVFEPLASLAVPTLLALVLLAIAQLLLQISLLPLLLKPLGIHLPLREWLPLGITTATGNMIMPAQGGTIARSLYLKQRYAVSYSYSAAIVGYQFLIRSMTYLVIALTSIIAIAALHYPWYLSEVLVGVSLVIALSLCGALLYLNIQRGQLSTRFGALFTAWKVLLRNKVVLVCAVMINVSVLVLNAITFAILLRELGTVIPLAIVLAYTATKFVVLMFSILPGNIGISEALTGGLTTLLSGQFDTGVAAALIARALMLLVGIIASGFAIVFMAKKRHGL